MKKQIFIVFLLISLSCVAQKKDKKNIVKVENIKKKEQQLSLLFIGDFMGHKDQIDAAFNHQDSSYNYTEVFKYIDTILKKPDFTIGNLEVTLGTKPYLGYPQFSSPPEYADAIKKAGVDVLVTANNHSCDKGKKGVEKTIQILDSLHIKHSGTYVNETTREKKHPLLLQKNGFKIALLNYTYGTNGINPTPPNIVNYLDKNTIKKDVEKAKLLNPDKIIAFVHWGEQYKNQPSEKQKKWFMFFKKHGVNIVIGAHPHVLQPLIFNPFKNTFVAYSLGNFISHQRTFPRDGGAILQLILIKKNNKTYIKKSSYILTWVYEPTINKQKKYFVLPVANFEKDSLFFRKKKEYYKMIRFTKYARKLLGEKNRNVSELKIISKR